MADRVAEGAPLCWMRTRSCCVWALVVVLSVIDVAASLGSLH